MGVEFLAVVIVGFVALGTLSALLFVRNRRNRRYRKIGHIDELKSVDLRDTAEWVTGESIIQKIRVPTNDAHYAISTGDFMPSSPSAIRTIDVTSSNIPLNVRAFAPSTAARGSRIVIRAVAFTEGLESSVENAARRLSADPFGAMGFAQTTVAVQPKQHLLTAVIDVASQGANLLSDAVQVRRLSLDLPAEVSVAFDFILEVELGTEVDALDCEVTMYLGPLMLAVLRPSIIVSDRSAPEIEVIPAGIDRVFASYSRHDAEIVDAIEVAARALGVDMFVDRRSLRSGDNWRVEVAKEIAHVDAFQLFWSKASASSESVRWEWIVALQRMDGSELPAGTRFIRPVRWEEDAPPLPPELKAYNMPFLPELVSS